VRENKKIKEKETKILHVKKKKIERVWKSFRSFRASELFAE
jgi:hypothetical protein